LACRPLRLAIACAALALALLSSAPASAQELLQNGGFEQGTTGWSSAGISISGCAPRSGDAALAVTTFAQQSLPGPLGAGAYAVSGWLKARSEAATAEVSLLWLDESGADLTGTKKTVSAGADYARFSLSANAPAAAHGLRIRITGAVCLDDLHLEGPLAPPPSTATPPPAQQSSATGTPASKPQASATVKPTTTSQPSSAAADAGGPRGETLRNGGFEEGLTGWSKFGGTLSLVTSPVQSGARAGQLSSNTDSTKWAYQTIQVDASRVYEFAGYVGSDAGVGRAYLRISWYASADGSGAAISTTDSTDEIGAGTGLTYLTTGPVTPPPGAQSANARVLMTPLGATAAAIILDDLWFSAVEASPATESSPAAGTTQGDPTMSASDRVANTVSRQSSAPAAGTTAREQTREDGRVADAAAVAPEEAGMTGPLRVTPDDGGVPLVWLAGGAVFVIALGGSYLHGRRASG
jgi:hypothetical protein